MKQWKLSGHDLGIGETDTETDNKTIEILKRESSDVTNRSNSRHLEQSGDVIK